MEPLDLVDLNNRWRQAQIEEQQEIERILLYLSGLVAERQDEIVQAVMILAGVDLALAKARYAAALSATCPQLATDYRLDLIEARHPLLTGEVVPLSARLGGAAADGCRALIITGPNTGGKTVALKTMGLLSLMAQAGLHIPAEAGSVVAVWDDIFADIGDEQSIEQSLSTFSSHMTNIVQIMRTATPRCLVLLDEIGVGTDPQEGSALARAVLSDLVARRVCTVVTTHYSDLKAYAAAQPQVCNANVEFDANALRPTYRFHMGLPGRSYGLTIAAQLGLPEGVLDEARALLDPEAMQVDDLLASIQEERETALAARAAATEAQQAAGELRAELKERLARIEDERERVLAAAQVEAEGVLGAARRVLRRVERAAPAATPAAREQATAVEQEIAAVAAQAMELPARRVAPAKPAALAVGERVRVRRLNTVGRILAPPTDRGEVEVQLGTLRTRLPVADLMPTGGDSPARGGRRHRQSARRRRGCGCRRRHRWRWNTTCAAGAWRRPWRRSSGTSMMPTVAICPWCGLSTAEARGRCERPSAIGSASIRWSAILRRPIRPMAATGRRSSTWLGNGCGNAAGTICCRYGLVSVVARWT